MLFKPGYKIHLESCIVLDRDIYHFVFSNVFFVVENLYWQSDDHWLLCGSCPGISQRALKHNTDNANRLCQRENRCIQYCVCESAVSVLELSWHRLCCATQYRGYLFANNSASSGKANISPVCLIMQSH